MSEKKLAPKPRKVDEDPAPTPEQIAASITVTYQMRVRDRTLVITPANVPFKERTIVRKATGFPWETYSNIFDQDKIGSDSFEVMWWVARRLSGEAFLTLEESITDMGDALHRPSEFDIDILTDIEESEDPQS